MTEKKKVTFKYLYPDNYAPVYSNGAFGGPNLKGEILIHFYFESVNIPGTQEYQLNPDGSLGKDELIDPPNWNSAFIRRVNNGVILDLKSAIALHRWLGNKISQLQEQSKSSKPGDKDES